MLVMKVRNLHREVKDLKVLIPKEADGVFFFSHIVTL